MSFLYLVFRSKAKSIWFSSYWCSDILLTYLSTVAYSLQSLITSLKLVSMSRYRIWFERIPSFLIKQGLYKTQKAFFWNFHEALSFFPSPSPPSPPPALHTLTHIHKIKAIVFFSYQAFSQPKIMILKWQGTHQVLFKNIPSSLLNRSVLIRPLPLHFLQRRLISHP